MIAQILNGSIDASWFLGIAGVTIGFFMIRTLNGMDKRSERADRRIELVTRVLLQMLSRVGKGEDVEFYQGLSDQLNEK